MKVNPKNDYSNVLSSLNQQNSLGISLTDYASIKNNSYSKLMKAYYGKGSGKSKTSGSKASAKVDETTVKLASNVKSKASELKDSLQKVESYIKSGDTEKLTKAVSDFADAYNKTVSNVNSLGNSGITRSAQGIVDSIGYNLKLLDKAGISIDESGKMSVNEEKVKEAGTALKSLFSGVGSFGDTIASKASSIERAADRIVKSGPTLYDKTGDKNVVDASGNIFDSIM